MPNDLSLKTIHALAEESGFQLCGVKDLSPLGEIAAFKDWVSSGYHGTMKYLEDPESISRRGAPARFSPGSLSVLVLGARYPVNHVEKTPSDLSGRVSSYAWGKDYHSVLQTTAQTLISKLEKETGLSLSFRIAIDSSPVLEKPLGRHAGLGWQGKNSCLINPAVGSFFFLVNTFISVDVTDRLEEVHDRCGTCHRCVDACPTGCILPGRVIDARRCISYLTIENKGSIPRDLRACVGDWLFGCDICQAVCPWNQKMPDQDVSPDFLPNNFDNKFLLMANLIEISEQEFKHRFIDSPISRAKRRGLLRNAAVVMGNSGDSSAIPLLIQMLQHEPEPMVRAHAAWALGRFNTGFARAALSKSNYSEIDPLVLEEVTATLEAN